MSPLELEELLDEPFPLEPEEELLEELESPEELLELELVSPLELEELLDVSPLELEELELLDEELELLEEPVPPKSQLPALMPSPAKDM